MSRKSYTGYTEKTKENLVLDSGCFFKGFIVGTDTPETAKAKLIGATQEGGQFTAKAGYKAIPVDGVSGDLKGMEVIERWDVNLACNTIEVTPDTLKMALGAATITTEENYDVIEGKIDVADADYHDNITFVGCLSGSNKPVIIQVLNALCIDGLNLSSKDNDTMKVNLNFKGHLDETNVEKPPFKIYYPKKA